MPYFDEPVGRVKIQTTSKNSQRYYTSKRLISGLLTKDFFYQNSNLPSFLTFTRPVGMGRVQISCDISTRFERYLYSTKQSWITLGYSPVLGGEYSLHDAFKPIAREGRWIIINNY